MLSAEEERLLSLLPHPPLCLACGTMHVEIVHGRNCPIAKARYEKNSIVDLPMPVGLNVGDSITISFPANLDGDLTRRAIISDSRNSTQDHGPE